MTTFTQPVVTSAIDPADNQVGFQGDFTFNSTVVTFQNPPVSGAGLTGSNWNVSGNVLPGGGPIRTLRVSAFSNDFTPMSGSGTLFHLNMTRVSSTSGANTALTWKPDPDNFFFIAVDLSTNAPGSTPPGSSTIQAGATSSLSGTITYCSNPSLNPVPGVTLTLTGFMGGSTLSDGSGNYSFSSLPSGGAYTVTPTKAALAPGSSGINTVDVIAIQQQFLNLGTPLSGCQLTAADVDGNAAVNTVDVIAVQRFFLGMSTGLANTGHYLFTPVDRTYPGLVTSQTGQNFDALVFGDVATTFVYRSEGGPAQDAAEVPATVAAIALPDVAVDQLRTPKNSREQVPSRVQPAKSDFVAKVRTTAIDAKNKLVGFQGDFTFDERVVTFQSEPVQKAGITGGNWNVSGNILPGRGPIRTLRISAYSNDFTPLSGSGMLFALRMTRVSKAARSTPLLWAAPPDQFIFIDADLKTQKPGNAAPGRVALSGKRK